MHGYQTFVSGSPPSCSSKKERRTGSGGATAVQLLDHVQAGANGRAIGKARQPGYEEVGPLYWRVARHVVHLFAATSLRGPYSTPDGATLLGTLMRALQNSTDSWIARLGRDVYSRFQRHIA